MKNFIFTLLFSETLLELRRKISHIVFGVTILLAYFDNWLFSLEHSLLIRFMIVLAYIVLTNTRTSHPKLFLYSQILELIFERTRTIFSGIGGLTLLAGISLPIYLGLPETYIIIIILTLSLGDGTATIVGKYLGKYRIALSESRSLAGSLAGFITSLVGISMFVDINLEVVFLCFIGITIELIAGLVPKKIGNIIAYYSLDNILIPVGMILVTTVL